MPMAGAPRTDHVADGASHLLDVLDAHVLLVLGKLALFQHHHGGVVRQQLDRREARARQGDWDEERRSCSSENVPEPDRQIK